MKDPLASRQAVFLEMVSGTKPLPHEVDDFQYLRNAQLEHVFQTREIFLQPGVERLMTHQRQTGKKLIVVTGLEPHLVALLKTRIPELEQVPIYTRRPQEDDTVTMQRALADEGCEPSHCTAIFDSAAHVLAALNAGIASGPYPLFYVPSYEKIEAQALSLGHIDTEEAKKVYEAASIADIVIEW